MTMSAQPIIWIVSAVTLSVILVFGILLLSGWFIPETLPMPTRIGIGSVMLLYSVYRGVMMWIRFRKAGQHENN